jgi:hypothetical protein
MADSAVAITAGTGTNIDTRTESVNGDHRQVVVLGDPVTGANVATVSSSGALNVQGLQSARTAYSITATGNSGAIACVGYNIATVTITGTYAAVTLVFEGSDDGGTTWFAIQGVRVDSFVAESTSGSLTNTTRAWDIPIGAWTHFRVRASTWTSGTGTVGVSFQSMPYEPVPTVGVGQSYAARTAANYYAVGAASGATTVETAITLTKSLGTAATSTGVSHTPTAGKRFRIQTVVVATRGNATATVQSTTFNLRINTAGAVGTTSTPVILSLRSATPATASAWDRVFFDFHEGYEIVGDGTLQFGVTAAATFTTNAPTWDVAIIGFEY